MQGAGLHGRIPSSLKRSLMLLQGNPIFSSARRLSLTLYKNAPIVPCPCMMIALASVAWWLF